MFLFLSLSVHLRVASKGVKPESDRTSTRHAQLLVECAPRERMGRVEAAVGAHRRSDNGSSVMNRLPKCIEIEFLPDARDSRELQSRGVGDRGSLAHTRAPLPSVFTLPASRAFVQYYEYMYNRRVRSELHASPSHVRVSRGGQRPHALIRSGLAVFSDPLWFARRSCAHCL